MRIPHLRLLPLALLFALSVAPAAEIFDIGDFHAPPSFGLQGAARYDGPRLRLAPAATNQSGAVWWPVKRSVEGGFDTRFQFQVGAGGEGVAFVVQNNTLPALGRSGSGLGYAGVPNSLAIEFDASASADLGEAAGPHVSIHSRGTLSNDAGSAGVLASAAIPALGDGEIHIARVRYVPGLLEVFVDDVATPVLTAPVTLTNLFALENGQAWFGVAASSGANAAATEMLTWAFDLIPGPLEVALVSPLDGASFLTPAALLLEANVTGPDAVTQVQFFADRQLITTATNAPWRFATETMLPGAYTITAVASDSAGRRVASQPARVIVYPAEPVIGINFTTAPGGSNHALHATAKAGLLPQFYWNNAAMLTNGNGTLANLRNASGHITPIDVNYDFVRRGEEPAVDSELGDDYRLMRAYGANLIGLGQSNSTITISSIPYSIYDVIVYTDGANGLADRVSQVRAPGRSAFIRDAAGASFAGIYAGASGSSDAGGATPAGNYVRLNGLTSGTLTITNNARSATDGTALGAVNAIQIFPSVYDPNTPVFVTRGPYVQAGRTNGMTVRWRSNRPIVGRVSYGTEATNLTSFVQGTNATQEHILVITNLEPSTRYFYAVGTAETNLVSGTNIFFITSPHTNKPTRIWVLGDSGTAGNGPADRVVSVRDAFHNFNGNRYVDVWLMLGDNAYNSGTDAEYQAAVFNIFTNTLPQSPLWAALGNHETAGSHSQVPTTPHLLIFSPPQQGESGGVPSGNKRYYSFDYGDVHFVCLDSMTNDRSTNGPMANWLRADLEANTKTWTIAYFHHPPYTKGSHDSDNPNADFELIEMRENIVPILEAYNVDIVMAGHSHCYERSYLLHGHYGYSESLQPEMILDRGSGDPFTADPYVKTTRGTIYIVDGSSGQATFGTLDHPVHYKSILQLGSVVIDVDGNQLVAKFLRETGAIEDTFTIIKQGGGQASTILRIVAARAENGGLTMRWTAQPGGRYQVERSDGLDSPWQPASEVLTAMAADETWTIPISAGAGRGFFRVVKLP